MPRGLMTGLLALTLSLPAMAQSTGELPVEEVERIVREYLMREPEIIYEAIEELQARRQIAERERQRQAIGELQDEIFENPNDPIIGNPEGDVTLVEFFDYRCGYCRQMGPGMQELVEQDGELRVVMKEFPILGPDSVVAARAALAARMQGDYGSFHFALMEADNLTPEGVFQLAIDHNLDVTQLEEDMNGEEVAQQIGENIQLAEALGITGTPSFIVGETLVPGAASIEQLAQLVDQERNVTAAN